MSSLILAVVMFAAANVAARASGGAEPPSCPSRTLSAVPRNAWTPAGQELAPTGAAVVRLCGYAGLNSTVPLLLERSRLVTDETLLTKLVDEFDALPPEPKAVQFCPLDDGSQVLALLAYPGGRQVTVAVAETGCNQVSNGDLVRTADGYGKTPVGPRLVAELKVLAAPVRGDARVSGLVRLCGGPAPGRCFSQDATITALDAQGQVVSTGRTSEARFSLALPPGSYTLVASTGGTRGERHVVLAANKTVQVNIVIAVP